ncbi:ATP-dependent DNA helicase II subunit 2 [Myotisia sp. PD_48]|nr:ATP-dependent DNA helicase II subunit 2 [Myotisia sp. PD_48]
MADKEATVYIVDVGLSMGECNGGRDVSDLDWAMQYIWDRITTTVATGRKTATIGVIGLRTDETYNRMWDEHHEEAYAHLSVFQPIGQVLMPDIRTLRKKIKPSNTDEGDGMAHSLNDSNDAHANRPVAVSSIILAIDMIMQYCKKLKYKRKIVIVTNGHGAIDSDDLKGITKQINEENIELVVLGVDFDDPEFGVKEEDKDEVKAHNEAVYRELTQSCDGVFGTLEQAISELDTPRVKNVRGIPSFRGDLRLGDPSQYDSALSIQVERYYRTYPARPPPASSFVLSGAPPAEGQTSEESSATLNNERENQDDSADPALKLTSVKIARSYHISDKDAPGGKRDVERDDLARGYEYGRTAVHITESDENITQLETEAALELIGFIPSDNYDRYMNMSTANNIIAQKTNNKAILALSSIIHALFELECYAVGRLVTKDAKPPQLVLLAPSIEPEFECLLEVQLPFAEDVRSYRFPPLDKVLTVSGKVVKEHRNLPSEELLSAMEQYVDRMELTERGEEGWRAVHPTGTLPPVPEVIQKLSRFPENLLEQSKNALQKLIDASEIKKVPPKVKGRKRNRDADKPLSGLNVEELLQGEKRQRITPENAIPEFKQALVQTDDMKSVKDSVKQMCDIIEEQIKHSFGDANYDSVTEKLGTMRDELIAFEEPALYNDFVRKLKQKLLEDELGGDRRELWWLIRKSRLGLIDNKTLEFAGVTEQEARAFLSAKLSSA